MKWHPKITRQKIVKHNNRRPHLSIPLPPPDWQNTETASEEDSQGRGSANIDYKV